MGEETARFSQCAFKASSSCALIPLANHLESSLDQWKLWRQTALCTLSPPFSLEESDQYDAERLAVHARSGPLLLK